MTDTERFLDNAVCSLQDLYLCEEQYLTSYESRTLMSIYFKLEEIENELSERLDKND